MEERTLQPSQPDGPTTDNPAAPAHDDAPPSPRVPALSSSDETTDGESDDDEQGGFEFEFPSVSRDSPAGTASLADELFADGRIRPLYPVFGRRGGGVHGGRDDDGAAWRPSPPPAAPPRVRGQLGRLFLEESRARSSSTSSTASSSSSSAATVDDEGGVGLDGAPPESYCLWTPGGSSAPPSPRSPRKSGSTGSMARWRRIGELVVGRSHSDGKEKFMFLPTTTPPREANNHHDKPRPKPSPPASGRKGAPATRAAEVDAAHRIAYVAKGGGVPGGATPRRTFLPYREELVGFFANVNGISRSHHHPF